LILVSGFRFLISKIEEFIYMDHGRYIGELLTPKVALTQTTLSVANTATAGIQIDRSGYLSAMFIIDVNAVSGTSAALTIDLLQSTTSGSGFTSVTLPSPEVTGGAAVGLYGDPSVTVAPFPFGSTITAVSTIKFNVDLMSLDQYIKLNFTTSNTSSPSFTLNAWCILGMNYGLPVA